MIARPYRVGDSFRIQLSFDGPVFMDTPFTLQGTRLGAVGRPLQSIPDANCFIMTSDASGSIMDPEGIGGEYLVGAWTQASLATFNGVIPQGAVWADIYIAYDFKDPTQYMRMWIDHELVLTIDESLNTIVMGGPQTYKFEVSRSELPNNFFNIGIGPQGNNNFGKLMKVTLASADLGYSSVPWSIPLEYYATIVGHSPDSRSGNLNMLGPAGEAASALVAHAQNNPVLNSKGGTFELGTLLGVIPRATFVPFVKKQQMLHGKLVDLFVIPPNTTEYYIRILHSDSVVTVEDSYEHLAMYVYRTRLQPPVGRTLTHLNPVTPFRVGYKTIS